MIIKRRNIPSSYYCNKPLFYQIYSKRDEFPAKQTKTMHLLQKKIILNIA